MQMLPQYLELAILSLEEGVKGPVLHIHRDDHDWRGLGYHTLQEFIP